MSVIAVIPARGGSKGIPRKNLIDINGKPLIAYTIEAANQSRAIDTAIVSTDSQEIADVARSLGADVPFLRPEYLAGDKTPMHDVLVHALEWAERSLGNIEAVVLLQPTSPLRRVADIDRALEIFRLEETSSVVSVVEVPHHFNPTSVMRLEDHYLVPFLDNQPQILRRQDKPLVYARNGPSVLVTSPATLKGGTLYGGRCRAFPMDHRFSLDIDTLEDVAEVEAALKQSGTDDQY